MFYFQANSLRCEEYGASAWKLAKDKPEIRELMLKYLSSEPAVEDDVKSEPEDEPDPEDEFESADEGVSLIKLQKVSLP